MRMNRILMLFAMCLGSSWGAQVEVRVTVKSEDGLPIAGAQICVCAESEYLFPVPYARTERKRFEATTDRDGFAKIAFPCYDGDCHVYVSDEGYYPDRQLYVHFRSSYDRTKNRTLFEERRKDLNFILRRRRNPKPMYVFEKEWGWKFPARAGVFGFDLQVGDWVAPYGRGKVEDVRFDYVFTNANGRASCTGSLSFAESGAGGYIKRKVNAQNPFCFPTDYEALTNEVYASSFPFSVEGEDNVRGKRFGCELLSADEYMVLRTRVVLDARGKVIRAHYAQIQGPLLIGRRFSLYRSAFNPNENDPNIEYSDKDNKAPLSASD